MPETAGSTQLAPDNEVDARLRRMTRRSFATGAAAAAAGLGGWWWLRSRPEIDGLPWPLRRSLEFNERLARGYFKDSRLAPTFPLDRAGEPRVNGRHGLPEEVDPAAWRLRLEHDADAKRTVSLTLDDVKALPRVEMITELKCIEGWSQVVHWAGARLSDLADRHQVATRGGPRDAGRFGYVGLETPDGGYYVGLDIESALHPQTLLCYEMNGAPLTPGHGAPVRLAIPVKYGIKNIKCIGTIRFTDRRPRDYWAEQGYDWYAGH